MSNDSNSLNLLNRAIAEAEARFVADGLTCAASIPSGDGLDSRLAWGKQNGAWRLHFQAGDTQTLLCNASSVVRLRCAPLIPALHLAATQALKQQQADAFVVAAALSRWADGKEQKP